MELKILLERPGDSAEISRVTEAAFAQAEHSSGCEALIVEALRRRGRLSLSLVALQGEHLVGHVAFSEVALSSGAPGWFGLGPLSVEPAWQRLGVGRRLVEHGLDRLRASGAAGCVVLGDPAYYGRFGFQALEGLVYPGVPPEYFQALNFGAQLPSASVAYDAAFTEP